MGEGKKLQEILKEKKYTVTKLAADTGISVNTLYALIKRDSNISTSTLNKIAEAWHMSIDELSTLLSDTGEKKEPEEEKPYTFDTDVLYEKLDNFHNIIKKLNILSIQYREKIETANQLRDEIALLNKQQESIVAERDRLQMKLKLLENDILNQSTELDLIRKRLTDYTPTTPRSDQKAGVAAPEKIVQAPTTAPALHQEEPEVLAAAHARTDVKHTPEGLQHDLDIMKDNSEWE